MWYNISMDKKSKITLFVFLCMIVASMYLLYKRSFIDTNFEIIDSSTELENLDNLE